MQGEALKKKQGAEKRQIMKTTERARELFEEIRVDHGLSMVSTEEIDEAVRKEWVQNHDRFPTIEEIDAVIEEVRHGR